MNAQDAHNKWLKDRLAKVASSEVWAVVSKKKDGKPYKERRNYMLRLIAEYFTGQPTEWYLSPPMQWGLETEPKARAAYEAKMNESVQADLGFIDHPKIPQAGCSPDGYVGRDGLIEIKCPETSTHLQLLIDPMFLPHEREEWLWQIHWQLACHPERKWCDLWVFDPRLPLAAQTFRKRINRDKGIIKMMEGEVIPFLLEMSQHIERIEAGGGHALSEHVDA